MKSYSYKKLSTNLKLGLLCLIFAILSPLCHAFDTESTAKARAILVTSTLPKIENWSLQITAQGEVLPWQVATVSSKTSGINATDIKVFEGDHVEKGQILAEFDNRILRAELNQKKADLELAQANLNLAQTNLKRFNQAEFRKTLSQQEFDIVNNQMEVAAANLKQAIAAKSLAQIRLEDATVVSPENGQILERTLELGQVSQPGEVLFRILRQHKLEWIAEVDTIELAKIKPGMLAIVNSIDGRELTGKVRIVSPQLSRQSRLGRVHVLLDANQSVAVNSYYKGKIIIGNKNMLTLPANTVVIKDGKTFVFRIKDGKAEQQLVKLGQRYQDKIEVITGVKETDIIALEGAGFLNDDDNVAIKNITNSAATGIN